MQPNTVSPRHAVRPVTRIVGSALLALFAALLPSLSGCIAPRAEQTAVPLYPHSGQALPGGALARVSGYVRYIDGQDVSGSGSSFELLPGCHLLSTPTRLPVPAWPRADGAPLGVQTGELVFAVEMRVGYHYRVEVEPWSSAISVGVRVHEDNEHGVTTRVFAPLSSDHAATACHESFPVAGQNRRAFDGAKHVDGPGDHL
jgi:hypothetical protein